MENVRLLVQEEGRAARNVIAFHVDLSDPESGKVLSKKPPSSPRLPHEMRMTKRSSVSAKSGSRVRSASTGRDKKSELQARYWAFLFGNLKRAVDEIYQTCETDENVSECKEVILVLENFTRDFHNLIEWFKLKWEYENTPPPQRPTSLAWEVRKSSPGKIPRGMSSPAQRRLDFRKSSQPDIIDDDKQLAEPISADEDNDYGLRFGDVVIDKHLLSVKDSVVISSDESVLINENSVSRCDDALNVKNGSDEGKEINEKESKIEEDIKSSEDKELKFEEDIANSGREKKNNEQEEKGKTVDVNMYVTSDHMDIITTDQASQTENQKSSVLLKNVKNASLTPKKLFIGSRSTTSTPSKTTSNALTSINTKSNVSVAARKLPLSPTSVAPVKSQTSLHIPGRNVSAAVFVPSKKSGSVPQSVQKQCITPLSPTNLSENVGINPDESELAKESSSKIQNNTSVDSEVIKNESNKELVMEERKKDVVTGERKKDECVEVNLIASEVVQKEGLVGSTGSGIIELKVHVAEVEQQTDNHEVKNDSTEKTLGKVHSENCPAAVGRNPMKIMCDKTVMTDFPLLPSTVPKQPLHRSNSVYKNKSSVFSRKATEPIVPVTNTSSTDSRKLGSVTSSAVVKNSTSSNTYLPLKKSESVVEKPAYSAVSKLYRSKTAVEIRQTSYRRNNQNFKYQNSVDRNKQVQPVPQRRHSDGKNMMSNNTLKKENFSMSTNELKKKVISADDDGWETVKARSRWRLNPLSQSSGNIKLRSMNPKSRYYLPSPATSLPALPVSLDNHEEVNHKPEKFQKDKQNSEILKSSKVNNKAPPVLRNKSIKKDVSEANSVKKHFKNSNAENESSLSKKITAKESFKKINTTGPDPKKTNLKEKTPKQSDEGIKQMNGDVLTDMLESKLEEEGIDEEEIRKSRELDEEEKMLTKKIQDLESTEIEVDTETDETETDGEVTGAGEEEVQGRISNLKASYENALQKMSWADQMDTLDKLEELMALDVSNKGTAWKDRMSTLEQLEELVARHPGRALELHQKLSSPSRRRTLPDTIQRYHARQASAKRKREQLLQDKSAKMRELLNKVGEVKMAQAQLIEERKLRLAEKLKRAEENRALHLRSIQRKAHDEEEKLREIAFINELEAQNKRHDFMALCQEQQERLQGILDERQRKQEEKAAKEAAVEERRRILEAERQEKLEKMQERRRKREERIGRELLEKEKERLELAREKARDREERLQALQAAQLANAEELQKKIQQKQEESARRHEENIEHIRQKALETGALRCSADDVAPRSAPYDTKKHCLVCNVLIESDVYLLSHLRGQAHKEAVKGQDDPDGVIVDAPADKMDAKIAQERERQKALRKRCKKIRTRMAQRGDEYLSKQYVNNIKKLESSNKGRLMKCIKDVDKLHVSQGTGQWPNNAITLLERSLGEINRILDKKNSLDQSIFRDLNGFTTLSNILNLALDIPKNMSPYLPSKCFLTTCNVYSLACSGSTENSKYVVMSNKIALLMDLLLNRLNAVIPDDCCRLVTLPVDPVAGALMRLFALVIGHASENGDKDVSDIVPRLQDIISYSVSVGIVDKLAVYCSSVRDPIDGNQQAAQFLLSAIKLLTTLAQARCGNGKNDPTQLIATLRVTELFGAVSMLYGMLLHQEAPARDVASPPPALPAHTVAVTKATLCLLKAVAQLDLSMFQRVLGAEGISLQLRHIASYLLWYCCHVNEKELLHQVVEVVGFFAVKHRENQMILQSGYMPTVLQQLCNLPFEYFSNPALSYLLFPTLLACCHNNPDNRAILEQELSYQTIQQHSSLSLKGLSFGDQQSLTRRMSKPLTPETSARL